MIYKLLAQTSVNYPVPISNEPVIFEADTPEQAIKDAKNFYPRAEFEVIEAYTLCEGCS